MRAFLLPLSALALMIVCARSALADTTVWLKFPALPAAPTQAQRDAIKAGLEAKYAFEPNIHFTLTIPATGTANVFTIEFQSGTAAEYGDSSRPERKGWVRMGNFNPGTDHHPEGDFFTDDTKKKHGMVDTAAHELGHLFGLEHNCNAPATEDYVDTPNGRVRFPRTKGNGVLVGGRTGLMADGHKVLPSEVADDQRDFTAGEKDDVMAFIAKLKGVTLTPDNPRRGNTSSSKSHKAVKGVRPTLVDPVPPYPNTTPSPRACPWVDIHVDFINNAAIEFGFVAIDGGFRKLCDPGVPTDDFSMPPGAIYDFAIHQQGAPASQRVSFTEGQFLPQPSQPVDPALSVEPVVAQPYFRSITLFVDTDNNPATQPLIAILSLHDPDLYDGLLPVPGCIGDFNNLNGLTIQDIFDFLSAWFAGDPRADFDGQGGPQIADIFAFLTAWFAGCT